MRILVTVLVLSSLAQPALAEDWKRLQDRGYSVMELDVQSISSSGAFKTATIREVFARPDTLSNGKQYEARNMALKIDCTKGAAAIRKITYLYHGSPIYTLQVPPDRLEFQSMEKRGVLARLVCDA